jgi:hypothetical protein
MAFTPRDLAEMALHHLEMAEAHLAADEPYEAQAHAVCSIACTLAGGRRAPGPEMLGAGWKRTDDR